MRTVLVSSLVLLAFAATGVPQTLGTFTATGSMTTPRVGHSATLLPDSHVLITGGYGNSSELYDPSTGTFSPTGNMTTARTWHTATLLPNGTVLIAGGDDSSPPGSGAELYDPATETFSATDAMTKPGVLHRAVLPANGKVLLVGGEASDPSYPSDITAEIYDTATGTFAATGSFISAGPLTAFTALLADGRVLVVGEYSGLAGLYDPAAGTFSPTGNPSWRHSSAIPLANGKVLFMGGTDDDGWDSRTELYDPTVGTFTSAGNMTRQRTDQSSALLADGTVLIAGGDPDPSTGSTELYNPVTGMFSVTGNMNKDRLDPAQLLPDGTVLIAGGTGFGGFSPGTLAEIYHPFNPKPAPVLLYLSQGRGAIWNPQTGQIASPDNPATAGDVLSMYTTSLFEDGVIPPQVAVGGRSFFIHFAARQSDPPATPAEPECNKPPARLTLATAPSRRT